eukprot:2372035-Amphidinium_carterae.1
MGVSRLATELFSSHVQLHVVVLWQQQNVRLEEMEFHENSSVRIEVGAHLVQVEIIGSIHSPRRVTLLQGFGQSIGRKILAGLCAITEVYGGAHVQRRSSHASKSLTASHSEVQVPAAISDLPAGMPPPPPVPYIVKVLACGAVKLLSLVSIHAHQVDDSGLHLCCPYMKLERQ